MSETFLTGFPGRSVQRSRSGCRQEVASHALTVGHQRSVRDRTEGVSSAALVAAGLATSQMRLRSIIFEVLNFWIPFPMYPRVYIPLFIPYNFQPTNPGL